MPSVWCGPQSQGLSVREVRLSVMFRCVRRSKERYVQRVFVRCGCHVEMRAPLYREVCPESVREVRLSC